MSKKWYVVHAYSGFEKSVTRSLKERITREEMEDQFGQILVQGFYLTCAVKTHVYSLPALRPVGRKAPLPASTKQNRCLDV